MVVMEVEARTFGTVERGEGLGKRGRERGPFRVQRVGIELPCIRGDRGCQVSTFSCVRALVRGCVRRCVRGCVRVCVCACMRSCVRFDYAVIWDVEVYV